MTQEIEQIHKVKLFAPEYRLYETFREHALNFNPPEESLSVEFTRNLAHPMLLLRLSSDRLNKKVPL